jgi:hypothetical protein
MGTKALSNRAITYNSLTTFAAHLNKASLKTVVKVMDSTTLASTAQENNPGAPSYTMPVGGPWSKTLDDVIGADADSPPTTLRTFVDQVGPVANRVTRTWTGSATVGAFISDYSVDTDDPLGNITWSGTLTISGSPVRT